MVSFDPVLLTVSWRKHWNWRRCFGFNFRWVASSFFCSVRRLSPAAYGVCSGVYAIVRAVFCKAAAEMAAPRIATTTVILYAQTMRYFSITIVTRHFNELPKQCWCIKSCRTRSCIHPEIFTVVFQPHKTIVVSNIGRGAVIIDVSCPAAELMGEPSKYHCKKSKKGSVSKIPKWFIYITEVSCMRLTCWNDDKRNISIDAGTYKHFNKAARSVHMFEFPGLLKV